MLKGLFVFIIGVAIITTATGLCEAFKDNIVAAWTFEEGAGNDIHDVSGNSNDGDLIGGADWVDGKFGSALDFDGSSGHIEIPFDDSMNLLNAGDFTMAAWFKPDGVPGENKEVFQQGDAGGTGRTWLFIASGGGEIGAYVGGGTTTSGINAEAGQWYHTAVVVTEGGGTDAIQLYVNGEPAGAVVALGMEDAEGPYFIGCHKDLTNFWDGVIDEVVLINKALNEAEARDLMDNGIASILAVEPTDKLAVSWGSVKSNATF